MLTLLEKANPEGYPAGTATMHNGANGVALATACGREFCTSSEDSPTVQGRLCDKGVAHDGCLL
jgi:hypothetical protein